VTEGNENKVNNGINRRRSILVAELRNSIVVSNHETDIAQNTIESKSELKWHFVEKSAVGNQGEGRVIYSTT
jgi:hypothetical protein